MNEVERVPFNLYYTHKHSKGAVYGIFHVIYKKIFTIHIKTIVFFTGTDYDVFYIFVFCTNRQRIRFLKL